MLAEAEQVINYYIPWCKSSVENLLESIPRDLENNSLERVFLKIKFINESLDFMVDYLISCDDSKDWMFNMDSDYDYYEKIVKKYYADLVISKKYYDFLPNIVKLYKEKFFK